MIWREEKLFSKEFVLEKPNPAATTKNDDFFIFLLTENKYYYIHIETKKYMEEREKQQGNEKVVSPLKYNIELFSLFVSHIPIVLGRGGGDV